MPRRLLERCQPDSIREFRAAALQRFVDAVSLADLGRRTAAIYLWGYSAEMTLKAAYFWLVGFPETQTITLADLRSAAVNGVKLGVSWPGGPKAPRLHDLYSWAELILATRAATPGWAYADMTFPNQVRARSRPLQRFWSEVLRYHKNVAYLYEVQQVKEAAGWLLSQSSQL